MEHDPAHLASAFFVSPFDEVAVCAIDGFGDFVSTSWTIGCGSTLEVLEDEYFIGAVPDPFMIQVYPVRPEKRGAILAVTYVDGSGRLQTVNRQTNLLYWRLLNAFETLTGVPALLNTCFSENEPIVHRPEEALDCFLRTKMDVLVLGKYVMKKEGDELSRLVTRRSAKELQPLAQDIAPRSRGSYYKRFQSSTAISRPMIPSTSRIIIRSCGTEYSAFNGSARRWCS